MLDHHVEEFDLVGGDARIREKAAEGLGDGGAVEPDQRADKGAEPVGELGGLFDMSRLTNASRQQHLP
ncbi:hypothetical protein D3C72_2400070 [compost metagenome]